jgi:hypothetical protein
MDYSPLRESLILSLFHRPFLIRGGHASVFPPSVSPSDIGSSISRRRGSLLRSPMSAYDPYNPYPSYGYGSYPRRYGGMYGGVPLTGSYYPYGPSYASSYAPSYASSYVPSYASSYASSYAPSYAPSYASTAYTPYTNGQYTTRSHHTGRGHHEKMYFNYDGKLIRSAKIWDYKVGHFGLVSGITVVDVDDFLCVNPESPETGPRLVPRPGVRHRCLPHPVLCNASWIFFPRTLHPLEIVHLGGRVAIGNGHLGRARDSGDRDSR